MEEVKVKAEKLDCPLVIVAVARTIHVNYKSNLAPPCECETPCRRYSAFLKRGTASAITSYENCRGKCHRNEKPHGKRGGRMSQLKH